MFRNSTKLLLLTAPSFITVQIPERCRHETQAKETCEKDVKTMKNENFKIPRHRFVKQTIPI